MKILLVDVDSKIPNLALMKLSTYHKSLGDWVNMEKLGLDGYPTKKKLKVVDAIGYDKVYASCIFTANKDWFKIINCSDVIVGGTGINLIQILPQEIDSLSEDYSIYPDNTWSYGFITRGCIRNCYFCFVPKKEGRITYYRDWKNIVKFKKTDFLDNNFLAYPDHKKILQELINNNIHFKFNSGLDIRLIDGENAKLLSQCNYIGEFIFAFDDKKYENIITTKLNIVKHYVSTDWKLKFDIYCHPSMQMYDTIFRINWCRSNKVLPYLMRDKECWNSKNNNFYVDLAAYCNQPNIFKKMSFEQYIVKRHPSKNSADRVNESLRLWEGKDENTL